MINIYTDSYDTSSAKYTQHTETVNMNGRHQLLH